MHKSSTKVLNHLVFSVKNLFYSWQTLLETGEFGMFGVLFEDLEGRERAGEDALDDFPPPLPSNALILQPME